MGLVPSVSRPHGGASRSGSWVIAALFGAVACLGQPNGITFSGFPRTPLMLGTDYSIVVSRTHESARNPNTNVTDPQVQITPFTSCKCIQFSPQSIELPKGRQSARFTARATHPPADAAKRVRISYRLQAATAFTDPCPRWLVLSGQAPHYCVVTINPFNTNGHKGFAGIAFVLAVNLAIWISAILYFVLWKTIRCSDQPGLFIRDPRTKNGPPGKGTWTEGGQNYQYITHGEYCTFTERVRTFYATPCDGKEVSALCGPDAVLYLRLQRDAIWLLLGLSCVALFVVIPVNVVQAKQRGFEGFESTTIKHVPRGSSVLWLHVGFVYLLTCSFGFYLRYLFLQMLHDRETAHPWAIVSLHTMFITDGPPPSATGERLMCHLRHLFPGDIIHAITVPQLGSYLAQYNAWDSRQRALERSIAIKQGSVNGKLPLCVKVCPGDACCPSPIDFIRVYCSCLCCDSRASRVDDASASSSTRITVSEAEMSSLLGRKSVADARRLECEAERARRAVAMSAQDLVCNGRALVTFRTLAARRMCVDLLPYRGDRMIKLLQQGKSLTGARAARTAILNANLQKAAEAAGVQDPEEIIEEARQLRMMDWEVQTAVEPNDVDWRNISRLQRWRVPIFIFINFMVTLLVVVCSSPVALVSAMKSISFSFNDQNATNHGDNAPQVQEAHSSSPLPGFLTRWLEDVKTMDPNLAAMLFQFLPPLYLICINYLLLMSLYSAARIEPHFTETGKMLSTLKKSFAYLLFSSLLLPCLGVASVTVLVHHVFNNSTDRYHAFIDAVSSFFVTACGEFFVNYVCQRTWLGTAVELMRFGQLWALQPWGVSRAVTEREVQEVAEPWPFYYGWEYGMVLSIFVIIIVTCVTVPLILPFGLLFFIVKTGIDKYNFFYVWPYHAGNGDLGLAAIHCLGIGLILMQVCMTGFFVYWGNTFQAIAVATLLVGTSAWGANWMLRERWVGLLRKADEKRAAVFPIHEGIECPKYRNPLVFDGDDGDKDVAAAPISKAPGGVV